MMAGFRLIYFAATISLALSADFQYIDLPAGAPPDR
jgi:hypothetical protein